MYTCLPLLSKLETLLPLSQWELEGDMGKTEPSDFELD